MCVEFLERNRQIGVVYTKAVRKEYRRNPDGRRRIESEYIDTRMEFDRTRLLTSNWIPNLSAVHRRSLLRQVPAYSDLPALEDYDFLLRLSSVAEFAHLPLVTGEYYVDKSLDSRNEQLRKANPELYHDILAEISATKRPCETSEAPRIAAFCFSDSGDDRQALKLAGRALQANPLNYWALRLFVDSSYKHGAYKHLCTRLERFLRDRPDRSDIWKDYALGEYRKKQYVKALRGLEVALATRETEDEAKILYRLIATCHMHLGEKDTAIACMLKSVRSAGHVDPGVLPDSSGLPVLPEGAVLDQWFRRGIWAKALKGLSYYHIYSNRWGHRAAARKILHILRRQSGS